jgi:hypothetical protein
MTVLDLNRKRVKRRDPRSQFAGDTVEATPGQLNEAFKTKSRVYWV